MNNPYFTPESSIVDGFAARNAAQKAYEQKALAGGEDYSEASGDYSQEEVITCRNEPGFPGERSWPPDDPRFVSNFLAKRIRQELGRADRPLIMLDVGSEFGTTAAWLADLFAAEIDANDLAIGVTNLAPSLEGHEKFLGDGGQHEKAVAAQERADGRLQFITSNARSLPDQTICLKNGTKIPLRNNVKLAHERHAVHYWSLTPGIDVLRTSEIIAPDGMYMVLASDCDRPYMPGMADTDLIRQRWEEIAFAIYYSRRRG